MRSRAYFPPILIFAVGASLCYWLWSRTGEILLDFGNELYTAWQLSQGKVLYRDIAYPYGPLSPTINATVMRVFGPSLTTILTANLFVLILTTALLYRLLRIIAGPFTATVATICFLCIFALSTPTRLTNYNFLTPYSHPIIHGFLLCLGTIACLDWFYRRRSQSAVILGGLLTGLAFLTKPEIFLGCAATYLLGLVAANYLTSAKSLPALLIDAVIAILLPPLATYLTYASQMPIHTALDGVLSGWQFINKPYVVSTPFYKGSFGTDAPFANSIRMFACAALYAAAASVLAIVALIIRRRSAILPVASALAVVGYFSLTEAGNYFDSFWPDAGCGLPLFSIFALILIFFRLTSARADFKVGRKTLLEWSLAILSLAFLTKIFLFSRTYHYGFILAVPAGMLAVIALLDWLPNWIQRRGGSRTIIQFGAISLLAAFVSHNLVLTHEVLAERTMPIPLILGGTAWTRPTNSAAVAAINWLAHTTATAVVIPDSVGINYAAGRPSSIPYTELNPMSLAMSGPDNVLAAFDRNPPDFILLMDFPEPAFGARTFGRDYALPLSHWIAQHYRRIATFHGGEHPIDLWKRKGH
ncbi:MAG TPA: glycosyltransferase family 39 protein [Tepidisphaeraceae bacterium]|jgi:hypothetical protein|nr:glycosyltransferase family 39 protein [Tepidisphaeraceae bacterium]